MSDAAAAPAKKAAPKKAPRKPKVLAAHPPIKAMVTAAIKNLKERKGSSLAAIKKYIAANYKCDVAKLAPFIRKCLKKGVADGKFTQVKGSGAAGSFRILKEDKPKKPTAKKVKKPKKVNKPKKVKKSPKKAAKPKKVKKPKAKKPKSPKKAAKPKKAKKSPKKAAKPKAKKAAKKAAKK